MLKLHGKAVKYCTSLQPSYRGCKKGPTVRIFVCQKHVEEKRSQRYDIPLYPEI